MLALAERAWAEQPAWETIENREERVQLLDADWNRFANSLGRRELGRLARMYGGVGYRMPPPGGVIVDDMLYANVAFPGLEVRFTTDGSEPTAASPLWRAPVRVDATVKVRAFDAAGRGGRPVMLERTGIQ
ncbi:MAG TPA: chitobiase/beta-hexosaminidase C-terminal domain-containing protein [Rhodothermales bacterium]